MPPHVMPLARLYEQHAEECARFAETAEDPNRRALLLKIADDWRRDADKLRQQTTNVGDASASPHNERRG